MISSENAPKKIVQLLIDLVNMAKCLMDENQQLSVTQELGRLFPIIRERERGKRGESSELLRVGAGESSDLLQQLIQTRPITKRTIEEIWGSNVTSKKSLKSMSHKTISGKTPKKFDTLSHVKLSDFRFVAWFISFLKFDLPRL